MNRETEVAKKNDSELLITGNFERLIRENEQYLRKFIYSKLWDKQDCDDIFQSTCIEAWRCFHSFKGRSHPKYWLTGIAFNMIKNHARRDSNNKNLCESLPDDLTMIEYSCNGVLDPAYILSGNELLGKALDAYRTLPSNMRETWDIVVSQEKSYEQAAKKLNIPLGTVRSRISRAREAIKVAVNNMEHGQS